MGSKLAPFGKAQQAVPYGSYCLTIAFYPPTLSKPQLWSIKFRPNPFPEQIAQFDLAGDFNSGARLLPRLYYSKRRCDELIRLAAFTILYGHLFNPSGVAGLDVLVGRDDEEPKFLEESDLNILRDDFNQKNQTHRNSNMCGRADPVSTIFHHPSHLRTPQGTTPGPCGIRIVQH